MGAAPAMRCWVPLCAVKACAELFIVVTAPARTITGWVSGRFPVMTRACESKIEPVPGPRTAGDPPTDEPSRGAATSFIERSRVATVVPARKATATATAAVISHRVRCDRSTARCRARRRTVLAGAATRRGSAKDSRMTRGLRMGRVQSAVGTVPWWALTMPTGFTALSGRTTSSGGVDTCRLVTVARGGMQAGAGWAGGLWGVEGTTMTEGSVEPTPVSCGYSEAPREANPQVSGDRGSSLQGRLTTTHPTSESASPGWGSRPGAADRYPLLADPGIAPSAVSGSVRRAATPRALTCAAGFGCTESRTDCGADRTAARIARSGGYRLAIFVYRSTCPGWAAGIAGPCAVGVTRVVPPFETISRRAPRG